MSNELNQITDKETVLYGIPKGETERYTEVLLLTNATPALIEKVKALASADGFHSFRVATIDLNVAPDFRKVINSGK
jgi:hypothetical protein